tara:strand:- start:7509 stop:7724 length:216 start_codon:yes stop_codon:yes gene_type:complete
MNTVHLTTAAYVGMAAATKNASFPKQPSQFLGQVRNQERRLAKLVQIGAPALVLENERTILARFQKREVSL